MTQKGFIQLQKEILEKDKIYPFALFIEKEEGLFQQCLAANSKLIDIDYQNILNSTIYVKEGQKKTCLTFFEKTEKDIFIIPQEQIRELNKAIEALVQEANFLPIIKECAYEICCWDKNISQEISNAIYLTEKLLTQDTLSNRVSALCYYLAKTSGIESPEDLSSIVIASMVYRVGLTQLNHSYMNRLEQEVLAQEEEYKKQIGLNFHLLNKFQFPLSENTRRIIQDYRENDDGSGFPLEKSAKGIFALARQLKAVDYLVHFAAGKIHASSYDLFKLINLVRQQAFPEGFENILELKQVEMLYYFLKPGKKQEV